MGDCFPQSGFLKRALCDVTVADKFTETNARGDAFRLGEQLILPLIHPKLQIVSDDISQVCLVMAIDGGL
jgi:hypothetical protein